MGGPKILGPPRYPNVTQNTIYDVANVGGLCYCLFMNTLDEIKTQVFCSQCGFVTSNFLEWAGEFWCEEECVAYLPTPESMEEQDFGDADEEWLASAGFGTDEDYGYF